MKDFFKIALKGIFVGIANIIPGVSGGTIAVVLGIFDELIDVINNFFKAPKKHLAFILPLLIGALFGIGLFSKIIKIGLENFAFGTNMFFVGLVVGSIPLIYKNASSKGNKKVNYIAAAAAFIVVAGISFMKPNDVDTEQSVDLIYLFSMLAGGIAASSAMVIPGISGSFVMVLIGMYNSVLTSISDFISLVKDNVINIGNTGFGTVFVNIVSADCFKILMFAAIGVIIGIIVISKIISVLLDKAFTMTYFVILGLIFGSLFSIFTDSATYSSGMDIVGIIAGIIMGVTGFFISVNLSK